MRAIIRGLILSDEELTGEIPADRWVSSGSLNDDNAPPRPFAVIRFGTTNRGIANVRRRLVTIWVHDDLGSYGRIDQIIGRLRDILDGEEHVSDSQGNELIRCDWESDSGDLYDPGYRTITKNTSFNLVGTGV